MVAQPDYELEQFQPSSGVSSNGHGWIVNMLCSSPEKSCIPSRTSKSRLGHFLVATVE